ncbi:cytidylyltransferase domain-containing protein [Gillisia sp. CAL575]|uniref:cytidylyltransferase domain-containing protein n=1 Tax=Gillisia sp. CAL575 TaxID=985255 RepID=UPI0003A8B866|nr:hypothetical protein [Gillisia sp. CAL575]
MEKLAIIIQARMSSSRLPGKSLQLIGYKPLIFYVIERFRVLKLPIIVATSTDTSDDILVDYLKSLEGIAIFRGSLDNVLNRYIAAADKFGVNNIIRVTGDNPLVDIVVLRKSLSLFLKYNYLDGIYQNGLVKGTGFELVSLKELKSITSKKSYHLEHVTAALRENIPKNPKYKEIQVPDYHQFIDKIILTCDYEEDLELLKKVFAFFKYNLNITIPEVVQLYKIKPELFALNASLHL